MVKSLVIDTSVFVNPASGQSFGNSPASALTEFLRLAKNNQNVEVLMPPSIYSELMYFIEPKSVPEDLLIYIQQIAPKKHELRVPGFFIYSLVESFRDRVDRGLRLAERHVREALVSPVPETGKTKDPAAIREDAKQISSLRESFRRMMREGMLDSKADVDLLLLAYEKNGTLISADEGVLLWAENLGLSVLPHAQLKPLISQP